MTKSCIGRQDFAKTAAMRRLGLVSRQDKTPAKRRLSNDNGGIVHISGSVPSSPPRTSNYVRRCFQIAIITSLLLLNLQLALWNFLNITAVPESAQLEEKHKDELWPVQDFPKPYCQVEPVLPILQNTSKVFLFLQSGDSTKEVLSRVNSNFFSGAIVPKVENASTSSSASNFLPSQLSSFFTNSSDPILQWLQPLHQALNSLPDGTFLLMWLDSSSTASATVSPWSIMKPAPYLIELMIRYKRNLLVTKLPYSSKPFNLLLRENLLSVFDPQPYYSKWCRGITKWQHDTSKHWELERNIIVLRNDGAIRKFMQSLLHSAESMSNDMNTPVAIKLSLLWQRLLQCQYDQPARMSVDGKGICASDGDHRPLYQMFRLPLYPRAAKLPEDLPRVVHISGNLVSSTVEATKQRFQQAVTSHIHNREDAVFYSQPPDFILKDARWKKQHLLFLSDAQHASKIGGGGFGFWKPLVMLHYLEEEMDEGDFCVFSDWDNSHEELTLPVDKYASSVARIVEDMDREELNFAAFLDDRVQQGSYVKQTVQQSFCEDNQINPMNHPYWSGLVIARNTPASRQLLQQWVTAMSNYDMLTNEAPTPGTVFKEQRVDFIFPSLLLHCRYPDAVQVSSEVVSYSPGSSSTVLRMFRLPERTELDITLLDGKTENKWNSMFSPPATATRKNVRVSSRTIVNGQVIRTSTHPANSHIPLSAILGRGGR